MDEIKESINNVVVWPVYGAVVGSVNRAVYGAVGGAVSMPVHLDVYWAMGKPLSSNIEAIVNQMTETE